MGYHKGWLPACEIDENNKTLMNHVHAAIHLYGAAVTLAPSRSFSSAPFELVFCNDPLEPK